MVRVNEGEVGRVTDGPAAPALEPPVVLVDGGVGLQVGQEERRPGGGIVEVTLDAVMSALVVVLERQDESAPCSTI